MKILLNLPKSPMFLMNTLCNGASVSSCVTDLYYDLILTEYTVVDYCSICPMLEDVRRYYSGLCLRLDCLFVLKGYRLCYTNNDY